jgi:imidazole glycerol phosphate synthase subunit HisF
MYPRPLFAPIAGPNGEQYCWWQCTVKGGREGRDVDAVQLAKVGQGQGQNQPGRPTHTVTQPALLTTLRTYLPVGTWSTVRRNIGPNTHWRLSWWLQAVEDLGAGEILLNCIDNDGAGQGFDIELVDAVSGGCPQPKLPAHRWKPSCSPAHVGEVVG